MVCVLVVVCDLLTPGDEFSCHCVVLLGLSLFQRHLRCVQSAVVGDDGLHLIQLLRLHQILIHQLQHSTTTRRHQEDDREGEGHREERQVKDEAMAERISERTQPQCVKRESSSAARQAVAVTA